MNEDRLVEELNRDEGMRPYPYRDSPWITGPSPDPIQQGSGHRGLFPGTMEKIDVEKLTIYQEINDISLQHVKIMSMS